MRMTRRLICMCLLLLLMAGCQPSAEEVQTPPNDSTPSGFDKMPNEEIAETTLLKVDNFERVVGWLSDEEIVYITRQRDDFLLHTYHIASGVTSNLLTIKDSILEVRIHPDLTKIAIVTSSNSLSATIHIFSVTGEKIDELTIESSEMYWDWHTNRSDKLFFSAFYEDWSFDSFVYSSKTKELKRIVTLDPFGKWGSDSTIHVINSEENDAISGGKERVIDTDTMRFRDLKESNTIYMETFKNLSVTVSISEDQKSFIYTLKDFNGKSAVFELPSISNYSQWFIPDMELLSDGSLVTYEASESGLMDTISPNYSLVKLSLDATTTEIAVGPYHLFTCSPSGQRCLIGVHLEEILMIESGQKTPWIQLKE